MYIYWALYRLYMQEEKQIMKEETDRLVIWTRECNGCMEYTIYDKKTTGVESGCVNSELAVQTIESAKRVRQ